MLIRFQTTRTPFLLSQLGAELHGVLPRYVSRGKIRTFSNINFAFPGFKIFEPVCHDSLSCCLVQHLDRTEQRLSSELKGQPEVEADLRHTIGRAYAALDDPVKPEAMHREALRLRTAALGERHADTLDSI